MVSPRGRVGQRRWRLLRILVIEATNNATGYDTSALAIADLPAVASNHFRAGCFLVSKSDGDFTFGTTALNAENTTVAYSPSSYT
jgi:hypothetical protein